VVFLKDSWRINLTDIQPEGDIYELLKDAQVSNIPECLAWGDISTNNYHATKTEFYTHKIWSCCRSKTYFISHRHYCLSLNVVGCTLMQYKSSFEMVSAVRDTLIDEFSQCRFG
jgi:hypothetical protein